jgi:hypothetical protein
LLLLVDLFAYGLYRADYEAAFGAHELSPAAGPRMALSFGQIVLSGFVLIFLYVAMRPRFGPGPRTAVIAAATLWVARWISPALYYLAIGLFPGRMLLIWLIVGLVGLIAAALLGGAIYREESPRL